jgi:hypothetical protein
VKGINFTIPSVLCASQRASTLCSLLDMYVHIALSSLKY